MSRHRKSPKEPVTATEASTATRCARQYYLEHVALAPIGAEAQRSRRAGTNRHLEYTRQHFGIGRRRKRSLLATILVALGLLALAWYALRAVGLIP